MRAADRPAQIVLLQGALDEVLQRRPHRRGRVQFAQGAAEAAQIQHQALFLAPFAAALALGAEQAAHLLDRRRAGAGLALAGVRQRAAEIAVAARIGFVAVQLAMAAEGHRPALAADRAALAQQLEMLGHHTLEDRVGARAHEAVHLHAGQGQAGLDVVGKAGGHVCRRLAQLARLAGQIALVVVRVADQQGLMAALALGTGEHIGGQEGAGQMAQMDAAVRRRRGDGDENAAHAGVLRACRLCSMLCWFHHRQ